MGEQEPREDIPYYQGTAKPFDGTLNIKTARQLDYVQKDVNLLPPPRNRAERRARMRRK